MPKSPENSEEIPSMNISPEGMEIIKKRDAENTATEADINKFSIRREEKLKELYNDKKEDTNENPQEFKEAA